MSMVSVNCDVCRRVFQAKSADRKRGWARCCGKRCAAIKREKRTGAFAAYRNRQQGIDDPQEFNDAHLFSNEEHDCNKD